MWTAPKRCSYQPHRGIGLQTPGNTCVLKERCIVERVVLKSGSVVHSEKNRRLLILNP